MTALAWQVAGRSALAVDDARSWHEAAHLYELAVDEAARSIDGAVELLQRAASAIADVRGTGDLAAAGGELAARITHATYVLTERHDSLIRRRQRASALFDDHRPGAAWVVLDRVPMCTATAKERDTLHVNSGRGGHCWPTADPHLDISELQRNALDAALAAERLVDEADEAALMCSGARQAIRDYVTALTIDIDLVSQVDPKIARARACLPPPRSRNRAAGLLTVAGFAAVLGLFHHLNSPR